MANIDPTAVVDRRAQVADDATIGPCCVIEGPAVVGAGSRLVGHVYLHGRVVIGVNNRIFPFTCIGFEPQDVRFTGESAGVVIGDDNVLRESVTIHGASGPEQPTTIGSHNYLMANAHAAHDVVIADHCTLVQGAVLGGHAQLAGQATVGGNSAVHQFCRMGRLSFLGGVSAITSDQPPFTIADGKNLIVGLNLVGLRRSGADRAAIDALKAAFNVLYRQRHSRPTAVSMIEQLAVEAGPGAALLGELAAFIRQSERGLVPHAATSQSQRMQRER